MKKTILTILLCGVMVVGITGCRQVEKKNELNDIEKIDMNDGDFKIVDKSKEIQGFACAEALEEFYNNGEFKYSWSCIKNEYIVVRYENGNEKLVSEALKDKDITIQDLDRFNIEYIKESN